MDIDTREIEWSDEHPLNQLATMRAEFRRMFGAPAVIDSEIEDGPIL